MKIKNLLTVIVILPIILNAQNLFTSEPFAHTFSIVARDSITGEMGVAVQSHWFAVGTIVSWGEAGVGVVATQSFVNPSFGPRGLALLKQGLNAQQVLNLLIESDEGRDFRQLAILDSKGNSAAYTGKSCVDDAGHIAENNYSVQANMMLNNTIWEAMSEAFKNSEGKLAERLLKTLEAAQNAGGDIRGKQSASILVVRAEPTGNIWQDRLVDIRVDDHLEPIEEIKRILKVHRAYEHMNNGDLAIEKNDMDLAMKEYSTAESMFPENEEMKYWHAVTLANIGKVDDSFPLFKEVFDKNKNWVTLTPRLIKSKLLKVSEENLSKILNQANK
ncbi:MAG: DUF1028 domain-containing protein [Ignavibacteriae bacterium]|nr:DUF1028 domain-containing protein [Ignavibacteriota bacterium]